MKNKTLSDKIFGVSQVPNPPIIGLLKIDDVRDFIKKLKERDEKTIIYDTLIDTYFPKGDKRRGDVLVILADLNAKLHQNKNRLAGNELIKEDDEVLRK